MATADAPRGPIKPWSSGIAPNYIGLFLWVAYYDQFGRATLGRSADGLRWPALGAVAGGLLAYLFLYYPAAAWGLRARKGFSALSRATFGESGSRWLAGPAIGLAQVGWFAVGTYYAADFTLRGLVALRLLDPGHLATSGRGSLEVAGPLLLGTGLLWGLAFAFVGQFAVRLVAAIMNVFPIFPALVVAAATARAITDLPGTRLPPGADSGSYLAFALAAQLVLAFFSGSAPMAADWGASSRDARDVRLGGLVGVAGSAAILAILGLLIVAGRPDRPAPAIEGPPAKRNFPRGAFPKAPKPATRPAPPPAEAAPTVGEVLQGGIGGTAGGAMLLVLALGSMAPAVYAAASFGREFSEAAPRVSRTAWPLIGTAIAFPLIALRLPAQAGPLFGVLGALIAPLLGALAADFVRSPGVWPGPRLGWNRPGVLAWLVGLGVGLLPIVGRVAGQARLSRWEPATGFAFVGAFVVYLVASRLGLEAGPSEPDQPPPRSEPSRLGGLPPGT